MNDTMAHSSGLVT